MTTKHPRIEFIAGDDWEIQATLLDENGVPYNLNLGNPVIKWRLVNVYGVAVIGDEAIITIVDPPNGLVSVVVPSAITSPVVGGTYMDDLRLIMANETGTLLTGIVEVRGDPWINPETLNYSYYLSIEQPTKVATTTTRKVHRIVA
jgi:hypothetical protein